tara:strand:+ start:171 stop:674 length:504 start_codon:yes stop_codon:yes gene_type:complete
MNLLDCLRIVFNAIKLLIDTDTVDDNALFDEILDLINKKPHRTMYTPKGGGPKILLAKLFIQAMENRNTCPVDTPIRMCLFDQKTRKLRRKLSIRDFIPFLDIIEEMELDTKNLFHKKLHILWKNMLSEVMKRDSGESRKRKRKRFGNTSLNFRGPGTPPPPTKRPR